MSAEADDLHPAIAEAAHRAIRAAFPAASDVRLSPLVGGHSGHNVVAELAGAPVDRAVLRIGAPGRPADGRHDIARQARILQALHGQPGIATPEVFAVVTDPPQAMVTTYLAGDSTEPVLHGIGDLSPTEIDARARSMARMLAALHAVDPTICDEPAVAIRGELDRWAATIATVDPSLVIGADELVEWLRRSIPRAIGPSIVHGDFRLGNAVARYGEIAGVVDWEIWTLTDPRVDLGWFLLFCDDDDWPGVGFEAPGMPSADQLIAEYEAAGGLVDDLEWFMAFGRLKMAAITAHNLRRHREGRHIDPYQEHLPPTIQRMVSTARALFPGAAAPFVPATTGAAARDR